MSYPDDIIKYMFETQRPDDSSGTLTITPGPHSGHPGRQAPAAPGPAADPGRPVPLERVEAQTCELAGHLAAATCRFLVLLADFDAHRGWASWDMRTATTPRSPRTPSSPPGTANTSTWTTPSTPASPTPATKPATKADKQLAPSRGKIGRASSRER